MAELDVKTTGGRRHHFDLSGEVRIGEGSIRYAMPSGPRGRSKKKFY